MNHDAIMNRIMYEWYTQHKRNKRYTGYGPATIDEPMKSNGCPGNYKSDACSGCDDYCDECRNNDQTICEEKVSTCEENPNKKVCLKCNGKGELDFGFYKRPCECQLK